MKYYDTADEVLKRAQSIRLLLLDVDGVLTNGQLFYGDHGEVMKGFNTLDGQGIKLLQHNGIQVGIISGRKSAALGRRAAALGINLIAQGREDKGNALDELLQTHPCPMDQIAYVGDDLPDLLVMRRIGLPIAVPNAHDSVHHCAALCTTRAGGEGAVRDVADFLLRTQGKYDEALRPYL